MGARIKIEKAALKSQIRSTAFSDGKVISFPIDKHQRLIVSYSGTRARKGYKRQRGLKNKVGKGWLTKANINNRGYNKYLKMDPNQEELHQIINETIEGVAYLKTRKLFFKPILI